jgi:hypothetical protein
MVLEKIGLKIEESVTWNFLRRLRRRLRKKYRKNKKLGLRQTPLGIGAFQEGGLEHTF